MNICLGSKVQLNANGGIEYEWLPPETLDFPYLSSPNATPYSTTEYTVLITTAQTNTITGSPCEFTLTTLVEVTELSSGLTPSATATPSVVIAGNQTSLVYYGQPGASVTWLPENSTDPLTGYTVSATPMKPTTYTAVARRGPCSKVIEVAVIVYSNVCDDKDVFVPNTFTPNGDGQNDIFRVKGLSVNEVYFAVYNRWGEKVYETNEREAGWDGRYKGKDADVGVFGWYLKVKCFNGDETFKKGNVTLIR
jgi:gliding motility-associated-like protein